MAAVSTAPKLNVDALRCCISGEIMTDPVSTPGGHSYERLKLEQWFTMSGTRTSPQTRATLVEADIRPNRNLKDMCDAFQALGQDAAPSQVHPMDVEAETKGVHLEAKQVCDGKTFLLAVTAPSGEAGPKHIIPVLDTSGSMDLDVESSGGERNGLSVLDLVKHSLATTTKNLRDQDYMTVIQYSTDSSLVINKTATNAAGEARINAAVKQLRPTYQTNIWAGLRLALEQAAVHHVPGVDTEIWFLTDGVPTAELSPRRGILQAFRDYLEDHPQLRVTVHTFGFGYSLDSCLLNDMAEVTGGRFHFIPDGGFVGTIFNHALANSMTVQARDLQLVVPDGPGGLSHVKHNLGTICSGQTRYFDLKHGLAPGAQLHYDAFVCQSSIPIQAPSDAPVVVKEQQFRLTAMDAVKMSITDRSGTVLQSLCEPVSRVETPYCQALLSDLRGQLKEAFSRDDWMHKWGKHYVRSWRHAQRDQVENNFKDPGVLIFGHDPVFAALLQQCDRAFDTIPAPTPSKFNASAGHVALTTCQSMNVSDGPCFAKDSWVVRREPDQVWRSITMDQIRKGDVLRCAAGTVGQVKCVIHTLRDATFVRLPMTGLTISPWHPVWAKKWFYPCQLSTDQVKVTEMYNLVMEDHAPPMEDHAPPMVGQTPSQTLSVYANLGGQAHKFPLVNHWASATLGHSVSGPVIGHPFLGSSAVTEELSRQSGWTEGLISLDPNAGRRAAHIASRKRGVASCQPGLIVSLC